MQAADASFGHGFTLSPVQVAAAFAAVANDGIYHAPSLLRGGVPGERVFTDGTARTVLHMLEGVVQRDDGTGTHARVPGYRVAGKTGTADGYASFVGALPADRPRAVILVGVNLPGQTHYANQVATPAFARIAGRVMTVLRVPPDAAP
jgi:cell division protein FtsI (penicillin-binding protein 3)